MANSYFSVPDTYQGKSLQQIAQEIGASGGYVPRTDVLASNAGISQNAALNKGQYISYNTDPGSGEFQFLQKNFGAPLSEGDYQNKIAIERQNAAVAPAIATLNAQKDPLKARYDKLIEDIKGRRDTAVNQVEIDTAREFAKRGVPVSSGAYDIALRNARTPVEQQYGQLETAAAGEEQDKLAALANAIAGLQAGAGKDAITQALQQLQQQTQASQFGQQLDLQKQELDLKKNAQANDPYGLFS